MRSYSWQMIIRDCKSITMFSFNDCIQQTKHALEKFHSCRNRSLVFCWCLQEDRKIWITLRCFPTCKFCPKSHHYSFYRSNLKCRLVVYPGLWLDRSLPPQLQKLVKSKRKQAVIMSSSYTCSEWNPCALPRVFISVHQKPSATRYVPIPNILDDLWFNHSSLTGYSNKIFLTVVDYKQQNSREMVR